MTDLDLQKPTVVTSPGALRRLTEQLLNEDIIAVDTESNSLYAYQEQVCLIQFSTSKEDFLVDPLAIEDLSPLGAVFGSSKVEKVFHAAEYDLIVLKRDFNFHFTNLFDTMMAARILGWEKLGLGSILGSEFGLKVNKRFQRANWGKRPLPHEMLTYAQLDTHFLIPLRHRLLSELKAGELWQLAKEDFRRLCQVNGRVHEDVAGTCWRVSGAYDLSPQQAAVLQALCAYRDQVARSINRPLFKVMHDRTLLAIAHTTPEDQEALSQIPGMSAKQLRRHGNAILQAVQRGLRAQPAYPPASSRPDEKYIIRMETLRQWRKSRARRMGVKSDVVLPRDLLNRIAAHNPKRIEELKPILKQVPWRLERFGEEILTALAEG